MTFGTLTIPLLLAACVLAAPLPRAQNAKRGSDFLSTLEPGQWVRMKGVVQKNSTVVCSEVRLMTGDFFDEDWSILGRIHDVQPRARTFRIGSFAVQVAENAVYEKPLRNFRDLRDGILVEADGTYRPNQPFLAKELDEESDEPGFKPGPASQVQIVAKVEKVDRARRRITAMKTEFQVVETTQLKSPLR